MTQLKTLAIGDYTPTNNDDGGVVWTVRLDRDSYFDTEDQWKAEVLSRLVRIELRVGRIETTLKGITS